MQPGVKRLPIVQISILFAQNLIARKQGNGNRSQRLLLYTSILSTEQKTVHLKLVLLCREACIEVVDDFMVSSHSWYHWQPCISKVCCCLMKSAAVQFNSGDSSCHLEFRVTDPHVKLLNLDLCCSWWTTSLNEMAGGIHGLVGTRGIDSPKSLIATNFLPFKASGILFASWIANPCKFHKANKSLRDMKELHHHPTFSILGLLYMGFY
jgi:hypothetical protein